jgi:hypothetical protein
MLWSEPARQVVLACEPRRLKPDEVKSLSGSNLTREQKRFGISAFTAKLKRAKVFVAHPLGYIRF